MVWLQGAIGQCIRYLERSLLAYGNRKGRTVVNGTSVAKRQARDDKGCVLLLSPERCLVLYGRDFRYLSFDIELLDDANKSKVQDVEDAIQDFASKVVRCITMALSPSVVFLLLLFVSCCCVRYGPLFFVLSGFLPCGVLGSVFGLCLCVLFCSSF